MVSEPRPGGLARQFREGRALSARRVPATDTPQPAASPPARGFVLPLPASWLPQPTVSPSPTLGGRIKESVELAINVLRRAHRLQREPPALPRGGLAIAAPGRAGRARLGHLDQRQPVRRGAAATPAAALSATLQAHDPLSARACQPQLFQTLLSASERAASPKPRPPPSAHGTWGSGTRLSILSPGPGGCGGRRRVRPPRRSGRPRPDPDPAARTRLHKTRRPAGRDKAGPDAGTYLGAERRPGGGRAGAHRSSPRPQPGREGRLRAAAGRTAGGGGRCHGARATRGARGAGSGGARGGARARAAGLRRRGRRTIASPCCRPPAPAGGPGPSGAGPAGLGAGPGSPNPHRPGTMATAAPLGSPQGSPARGC